MDLGPQFYSYPLTNFANRRWCHFKRWVSRGKADLNRLSKEIGFFVEDDSLSFRVFDLIQITDEFGLPLLRIFVLETHFDVAEGKYWPRKIFEEFDDFQQVYGI